MFLAFSTKLNQHFMRDVNEPCVHPTFSVIYDLWLVLDCWVISHWQQHWVTNALPVTSYFVMAASVLTFYFLVALSSFDVSHKLLAWDHCSTRLAAPSQFSSPRGFEDNPPVTAGTPTSPWAPVGIPSPLLAHHNGCSSSCEPLSLSTAPGIKLLLPLCLSLISKLYILFLSVCLLP